MRITRVLISALLLFSCAAQTTPEPKRYGKIVNFGSNPSGADALNATPPGSPLLWFDAQDIDLAKNTTFADGDLVGTADRPWKNKGSAGTAGDALATAGLQFKKVALAGSLNNGSSVVFGGTGLFRTGTISNTTQPITYLLVFKPTRLTPTQVLVDGNNDTNRNGIYLDPSAGYIDLFAGSVNVANWAVPPLNAYSFIVVKMDGANSIVQYNNWPPAMLEKALTVGAGSIDGIQFGGGRSGGGNFTGEFVELAAWKTSPPAMADIAVYVNAKYGRGSFPASAGYDGGTPRFTLHSGDHVAFYGDSFSGNTGILGRWWAQAGGFKDQVNAVIAVPIVDLQLGVDGRTAANLDANVNADVVALNPQPSVVIITDMFNDWLGWNANNAPTEAMFLASVRSVIAKLKAIPNVQIAWFNILSPNAEESPNPNYLSQSALNNVLARACLDAGVTVLDITSAKELYESIHNVPPPGAHVADLTQDTIHPSALGKVKMGTVAVARMNVVTP